MRKMTWEEARHEIKLHLDIMYPFNTPKDVLRVAHEALQQPRIVRCKDCRFSRKIPPVGQRKCDGAMEKIVSDDFFCADGERKDGEKE